MDKEAFFNSCQKIINREHKLNGIGTYGEKTVHAVLKCCYDTFEDNHEQKIGGYVADIVGENGIIEIQTAGFDKLRGKLEAFLSVSRVTVVYPVPYNKWLISISPETGLVGSKRKSPRKGSPYDVFDELYKIKPYINHKNFKLHIIMLDIEEYRCSPETSGLKRGRKKGYTRYDRIPVDFIDEICIDEKSDWLKLVPDGLPQAFTSKDFSKAAGINISSAQIALNILSHTETVQRIGKIGNSILYKIDDK
jgi:hypothetical protein